jgi:hypothetical protein
VWEDVGVTQTSALRNFGMLSQLAHDTLDR